MCPTDLDTAKILLIVLSNIGLQNFIPVLNQVNIYALVL